MPRFFKQSTEDKMKITSAQSKYFNGYKGSKQTNISPSEGIDVKETVRNLSYGMLIVC
jgi:isopenicillin N synthase-like dioxygenase